MIWMDLLSTPIARMKKFSDSNPLCVRIGTAGVELCGANEIVGDCDCVKRIWITIPTEPGSVINVTAVSFFYHFKVHLMQPCHL